MWTRASLASALLLIAAASTPLVAAQLPECPESPNCVSSQASDDGQRVAPLQAGSSASAAHDALLAVLQSRPRVSITVDEAGRVEAEFTSALFGFTDDVIFLINEDGSVDVRSASRVGYWDMGANRRRIEALRDSLQTGTGDSQGTD